MATIEEAVRSYRKKDKYPNNALGKLAKALRIPARHVELLYKRSVSKTVEAKAAVDYTGLTRAELYKAAKAKGLDVNSRTKKADLLKALKAS